MCCASRKVTAWRRYPVSIIGRRPTPGSPWSLGRTPAGWNVELIDYAPLIDATFEPLAVPANAGGQPAVHVRLATKMMNQALDTWLIAGDSEHDTLDMAGRASVQLRRGVAPTAAGGNKPAGPANAATPANATTPAPEPVDESVIAFELKPDEQVAQSAPGGTPSGAKVRLVKDASGKRVVFIDWRGASWNFDPDADHGKDQDLSGSGLNVTILDYWPDFVLGAKRSAVQRIHRAAQPRRGSCASTGVCRLPTPMISLRPAPPPGRPCPPAAAIPARPIRWSSTATTRVG